MKENIFFFIPTRKTFLYISFLHFCIVLANYKYLLEKRGEGLLSLTLPMSQSNRLIGKSYTRVFLSSLILQLLIISWIFFTPCLKCRQTLSIPDYPFASPTRYQGVALGVEVDIFTPSALHPLFVHAPPAIILYVL